MLAPGRHGPTRSTSDRKPNSSSAGAWTEISFGSSSRPALHGRLRAHVHDRLALAAVDGDVRPVDEARLRRGEEADEGRHLLGLADAPERDRARGEVVGRLLVDAEIAREGLLQRVPARGVHGPRVHGVDADAVTAVLLRERGGEVE